MNYSFFVICDHTIDKCVSGHCEMNCAIPVRWTVQFQCDEPWLNTTTMNWWMIGLGGVTMIPALNFLLHNKWTISNIIHLFTPSKLHGSFVINYVNIFSSQSAQVGQLWPAIIRCTLCVVQRASTIYLNIFFFGYAHLILTNIHRNDPY